MKVYHNPMCRKSWETLRIIEDRSEHVDIIEYLKTPPSKDDLVQIIAMLGISAFELVRKGEFIYKAYYKGKDLTDDEWINVMMQYPKLMERPIAIHRNKAVIGRPPEKVLEIL